MPRCGCSGSTVCSCLIVAGENASINGAGSSANPYRLNSVYSGSGFPASTMERFEANQNVLTGTGNLRLGGLTSRQDFVSTGVRMISGTTAAGATPTLVRAGLYIINSSGGGTLIASTVSDTALFATINTIYDKNWSTPVQITAGQRYAIGVLVVTAATAPTLAGAAQGNAMQTENAVLPWCATVLTGQANLPASFLNGALSLSVNAGYQRLIGSA